MNRNADRTVETRNAEQTEALGRALGENARAGLYLALTGELGVAAEWADLFEPPQGAHVLSLHFEWTGEETRRITLKAHCPAAVKLLAQLNMKFP
jgi:hypothetical protein